jgi:hypothetical protein
MSSNTSESRRTPLGRMRKPSDISDAVVWLGPDDAQQKMGQLDIARLHP